MSKYISLLKNIGLFTISNIAIKLVVFLLTPLYTYYLTTSEFGITDMSNTVISLLIPVVTLSIADAALRFIVEKRENALAYISVSFTITLGSCFIVFLLLPLLKLSIFGGLGNYRWWFLFAYSGMAFQVLGSNIARGLDQISLMTWSSIFSGVVNCILAVLLIAVLKLGIDGFFISLIGGNYAGVLCYLIWGKHYKYYKFSRKSLTRYMTPLLKYSLPLIPNALFWWVNQSINRFFITSILGIAASGLFAVASKIPSILNLLSSIFQQAWNLSAFQEFREDGREKFFNIIYSVYYSGMSISTAILITSTKWLASLLFQKTFYTAWVFVPVLLLTFFFNSLNSFFGSIFTSSMKTKALFSTTMIGAFICALTTYPLVKLFGLQGAGIAAMVSTFVVLEMRKKASRQILKISQNTVITSLTLILLFVIALCVVLNKPEAFIIAILGTVVLTLMHLYAMYKTLSVPLKNKY